MKITALLVAAGAGSRMSFLLPKAFLDLGGIQVQEWSLRTLQAHPAIDAIVLMTQGKMIEEARNLARAFPKVVAVVPGGARRQDTVELGLKHALRSEGKASAEDLVLVHDAARPFVPSEVIDRVIEAASRAGAAICGVKPADTIREIANGAAGDVLNRDRLILVQTPQGFHIDLLLRAQAATGDVDVTDDASQVAMMGHAVAVVAGSARNFKITTDGDLELARACAAHMRGPVRT